MKHTFTGTRSSQSPGSAHPALSQRRQSIPAPVVGMPLMFTWGPFDIAAGDSSRRIYQRFPSNMHFRHLAFGWRARAVSAAGPTLQLIGSTSDSTSTGFTGASVDLNATPSGTGYFRDSSATNYIANVISGSAANASDPTFPGVTLVTANRIGVILNGGGQTATDVCVYLMAWPTDHHNDDAALD